MSSKSAKRRSAAVTRETPGRSPAEDPVSALLALGHAFQGIEAARGEATPWLSLGLTMGQLKAVMLLVETGGMASRALADSLGTVRSAITPLVDRLIAQKLARREPDSKDRRVIWIRPTTRAMAMHQLLLSTRRPVLERVWAEVRPEHRETIRRSLEELLDAAERALDRLRGPRP
jgi:DNA-binding MarR family transcriptional regulator